MKFLTAAGIIALLFCLASCKSKTQEKSSKDKPPTGVEVIIAKDEMIASSIEVNGSVLSYEMVELHPEVSGRIIYLNMPDGANVPEGTILVRINDADLQAELEQQKSQLDLANKNEKRLRELLRINGVNQSDYDATLSQVHVLEAGIKVIEAQLDKTVIRAPFSGKLGLRGVSQGAYVTPQTVLGTLQQSDKVKIDFSVPETQASLVKPGNKVKIQMNGSGEQALATITAVEPQINSSTRNIKARAILSSGNLPPGAFVKVMLEQEHKGIIVPTNAIIPDAMSSQLVIVENNKASFRNVETGYRNPNQVEITSGIKPGDSIVVSGMLFVRPKGDLKIKRVVNIKLEKGQ